MQLEGVGARPNFNAPPPGWLPAPFEALKWVRENRQSVAIGLSVVAALVWLVSALASGRQR